MRSVSWAQVFGTFAVPLAIFGRLRAHNSVTEALAAHRKALSALWVRPAGRGPSSHALEAQEACHRRGM